MLPSIMALVYTSSYSFKLVMNELVEKIVIHAPDKSSGHREQHVEIHFFWYFERSRSCEALAARR